MSVDDLSDLEREMKMPELIAYRLGRLEKSVEKGNERSESTEDRVIEHTVLIASLMKSRDRMIAAISVIGTGVVAGFLNELVKRIGQ